MCHEEDYTLQKQNGMEWFMLAKLTTRICDISTLFHNCYTGSKRPPATVKREQLGWKRVMDPAR